MRMGSRGGVFGLSVSLFVSLSTTFGPVDTFRLFFKDSLYAQQVDPVIKVTCRWSTIDRNGLEAGKMLVLTWVDCSF